MGKRARQPAVAGQARASAGKVIRVGSDFSGIGTFNIALKNILSKLPSGKYTQENVFCSDKDQACEALLKQTCSPKVFYHDVTDRTAADVPATDLYSFTAPCTSFSVVGKKKASMTNVALARWPLTRWLTFQSASRRLWLQRMLHPLLRPATRASWSSC